VDGSHGQTKLEQSWVVWRTLRSLVEPFERINGFLEIRLGPSLSPGVDNRLNHLAGTLTGGAEAAVALQEDVREGSECRRPSAEVTAGSEDVYSEVDRNVQPFVIVCELLAHEHPSRQDGDEFEHIISKIDVVPLFRGSPALLKNSGNLGGKISGHFRQVLC
jgi:hypothetical protein